jgi:hypothetical protein
MSHPGDKKKANIVHLIQRICFWKYGPKSESLEEKESEITKFRQKVLDNRLIRKVTLSSPCLWASFHPLSPLLVVSTK